MSEGEAFYCPLIRSQYSSEPVPLECKLHRCFSGFFLSLYMGQDGENGLEFGISFPQVS